MGLSRAIQKQLVLEHVGAQVAQRFGNEHQGPPQVADGASDLLQDVFEKDKNPSRLIFGVASLPLGTSVELELIFEIANSRKRS